MFSKNRKCCSLALRREQSKYDDLPVLYTETRVWWMRYRSAIKFRKTMNENFDEYAFHDSRVHGISFVTEGFSSEVHLDIDCILRWPDCDADGDTLPLFTVSKGLLSFFDVTDLVMKVDWGTSGFTTAVSGIYIDRVVRQEAKTSLRFPAYYSWDIIFSDSTSQLSLGASSCIQKQVGNPLVVDRQFLLREERI
jgi:hypothetical protein